MTPQHRLKILIVYKCLGFPIRKTTEEHLYSFKKYADADTYYLKLDIGRKRWDSEEPVPAYLRRIDFDLIIFHYGFCAARWDGEESFLKAMDQVKGLKTSKALKVMMPQDEYYNPKVMVKFINEFPVNMVYSVSPESEWPKLYQGVDFDKVKFAKTLTGYLDDEAITKINGYLEVLPKKADIAYRARKMLAIYGRHAYMKGEIAGIFQEAAAPYKLVTDISVRAEDTIHGDNWYKFLVQSKYLIGVEGGATVLDWDGSIYKNGRDYLREHPDAGFEEMEEKIFPGLDGKLQLIAISPRHLEACATKTCQVLVESTYNGILKPGVHYLEVKKDFSNLKEVMESIQKDDLREKLVANAYRDIVESGLYSYRNFVKFIIETSLEQMPESFKTRKTIPSGFALTRNHFSDWLSWKKDFFWYKIYDRLPNRWVFLMPLVKVVGFLGLKKPLKKMYAAISGK